MAEQNIEHWGGSAAGIQHHYDAGNEFYRLWLDENIVYSSALWEEGDDKNDLAAAQIRKIDYHIKNAGAVAADRVLDIGCGWGPVLSRLVKHCGVKNAVGLTLSYEQKRYVDSLSLPGVEVLLENWVDYRPAKPFDAIISIGAFEHFTKPGFNRSEKIAVYRNFFRKSKSWLTRQGALSLQTIAYGNMDPKDASLFMQNEIFPDSELPKLSEIAEAAEGEFEIVTVRNDRLDYARTCEIWLHNLRARKSEALRLVGEEVFERYIQYLKLCVIGFHMAKAQLLRLKMKPLFQTWGRSEQ